MQIWDRLKQIQKKGKETTEIDLNQKNTHKLKKKKKVETTSVVKSYSSSFCCFFWTKYSTDMQPKVQTLVQNVGNY